MDDNSLRKAAVLLASLDPAMADGLLRQMDATAAQKLRTALDRLDEIDPDEQHQVIEEFFRIGPVVPAADHPGIELDDSLREKLGLAAAGTPHAPSGDLSDTLWHDDEPGPFRFLREADAQRLFPALEGEHPQTIALVVAHLAPERAAELLARLPGPLQVDVIRRLVRLEDTNPEVLREVEQGLRARLAQQMRCDRRRAVGMSALASILEAADRSVERQILHNLALHDRPLAGMLLRQPANLEQIDDLDDASLVTLLELADPQVAVLALAGSSPLLVERVLRQFPTREAHTIRSTLARLEPTPRQQMDRARRELLHLARRLQAEGRLSPTS